MTQAKPGKSAAGTDKLADLPHVLVVDDDDRIRALVSRYLQEEGFVVATAPDAAQAASILETLAFDVLVVDIMMPGQSGLDFTKGLREHSDIPVLLLTALGEVDDRIAGFETGADDYLPKPFEPKELVMRLQAILRRRPPPSAGTAGFRVGRWLYDPDHKELQDGDDIIRLTAVESNLLSALAARAGEAVSREALAAMIELEGGDRAIDVQVTRLRRKIEDDPKLPRALQTVRGKGYLLRVEEI